ncbi:hypothetical protein BGW38_004542 [Lunasporangiospora selenospora]|uniref:Uncharacterized protein n=1 Tax=Lunasporangiospora selenospora TaxID=979761 RepID=A0A9P6KGR0_9FUNG|nr:hypothetical protein BGW38_004542 [Lunasporangiospora selenospora]
MNSEDCQAESLNRMSPQTPLLHSQVLASNASYQTDIPIGVSHEVPLETSSESRIISGVEAQKLPVPQFESDKTALTLNNLLKERIVVKVDQLSADIPKRSRRIVVLYSVEPSEEEPPECHVVATVLSFKSDLHVELVLPEPFQMDLFDRQNYAKIQINDSPLASQKSLVLDDTWARIQPKSYDESSSSDGCDAMDEVSQALKDECDRLGSILEDINRNSAGELAPLELNGRMST